MFKLAPEGYPFIIGSLALTAPVFLVIPAGTLIPLALTAFMIYFFRDPERLIPEGKDLFVAPADGKVIVIRDVRETRRIGADMKQVSIFMSPFNVHVNRAPCAGRVKSVRHNKGSFFAAYKDEASIKNENIEMAFETEYGDILVRQVAGFLARRAVCRKNEGDVLKRGERYGIIKFSSRVDIYLPKDVTIKVKADEMVKAGETVIAELKTEFSI
ncbi:MAG: phosphatidylserine decarboxylase family protein [Nitrospira bacterium HGW-Nitrospira-1]|nr:MAG: phosphatidylserine decarboxylase family protein [Nitrospira bacterium HGW-Nitrospira-1]